MRRSALRAVALALALSACSFSIKGEATSEISIAMEIEPSGEVQVRETITLAVAPGGEVPPLSRRFWVNPATFPLRQMVADASVTDAGGRSLEARRRAYGDWINLDLLEVPEGPEPTIVIDYTIERGLELDGESATLRWALVGFFWNAPITSLELAVTAPGGFDPGAVSDEISIDYEEAEGARGAVVDGVYRWSYGERIERDQPVDWQITFARRSLPSPGGYAADLFEAAGVVPWALALLVIVALALAFLPPRLTIAATPLYNALALAAGLGVLSWNAWYWVFEGRYRGGELDSIASEQVGFLGFVVIFVGFAASQAHALRRGKRHAYFAQLALPIALALPAPMFSTNPALLFLPLLGLPVLLFWMRPAVALQFGAGIERVLELVETEGEIDLATLADRAGVLERQLARILADRPGLPIVVDFEARRAYSPSVAALKRDMLICPACGGATRSKGMELVSCAYCDREYAASREAKPRNPIPFSVSAVAAVLEMFGMLFIAWAGLVVVVFALLSLADGDLVVSIVAALIVGAPGLLFYGAAAKLRRGKRSVFVTLVFIALAPLIIPIVALARLNRNRAKLFFGTFPPERIGERVARDGELSLHALAEMLETDIDEAGEVARYLAGNNIIDAVFDRHGKRLVARAAYRSMAAEISCKNCGGVLGVIGGKAACHYCGETA